VKTEGDPARPDDGGRLRSSAGDQHAISVLTRDKLDGSSAAAADDLVRKKTPTSTSSLINSNKTDDVQTNAVDLSDIENSLSDVSAISFFTASDQTHAVAVDFRRQQ